MGKTTTEYQRVTIRARITCTKTISRCWILSQGNEGCINQNVKKNEEKVTKQKSPPASPMMECWWGLNFGFVFSVSVPSGRSRH